MTTFAASKCPTCKGEGFTLEYPSISFIMPEKKETQCSACHGFGEILFLPPKLRVIVDRDTETIARVKFK